MRHDWLLLGVASLLEPANAALFQLMARQTACTVPVPSQPGFSFGCRQFHTLSFCDPSAVIPLSQLPPMDVSLGRLDRSLGGVHSVALVVLRNLSLPDLGRFRSPRLPPEPRFVCLPANFSRPFAAFAPFTSLPALSAYLRLSAYALRRRWFQSDCRPSLLILLVAGFAAPKGRPYYRPPFPMLTISASQPMFRQFPPEFLAGLEEGAASDLVAYRPSHETLLKLLRVMRAYVERSRTVGEEEERIPSWALFVGFLCFFLVTLLVWIDRAFLNQSRPRSAAAQAATAGAGGWKMGGMLGRFPMHGGGSMGGPTGI